MSDVWDTDIIHFIASFNSVSVIPNIFILFFCLLCLKGYFYLNIKIQLSSSIITLVVFLKSDEVS